MLNIPTDRPTHNWLLPLLISNTYITLIDDVYKRTKKFTLSCIQSDSSLSLVNYGVFGG